MEQQLESAFSQTEAQASSSLRTLDTRSLNQTIKKFLQRSEDYQGDKVRVSEWCTSIFKSSLALDETLMLVWQVLYRVAPEVAESVGLDGRVWMYFGKFRAQLLSKRATSIMELEEMASYLLKIVTRGGIGSSLTAHLLEVAELVIRAADQPTFELAERLMRVLEGTICNRDELVQHKLRGLVLAFYQVSLSSKLQSELDLIVGNLEMEGKMRYLLLKDLLEAKIIVEGFTNPPNPTQLLVILTDNKALAPVIADCIVLLIIRNQWNTLDLIPDKDGYIGTYLFPRLVKRLPQHALALIEGLSKSAKDEDGLSKYCSLYSAIINGATSQLSLDMELIRRGLYGHCETLRNRAFSCLCRSTLMETVFTLNFHNYVLDYFLDAQLGSSPEVRQQTIAGVKYLLDVHFSRLYKLSREINSSIIMINPNFDSTILKTEIIAIKEFWKALIELCIKSLSPSGYFNKNDLCLKTLLCIVEVWQGRLAKCSQVGTLHDYMNDIVQDVQSPLKTVAFLSIIRDCVINSSYDTIRGTAADLLRWLDFTRDLSLDQRNDYLESIIMPILSENRAYLIDGASRLLKVYCEGTGDAMVIIRYLRGSLEVEETRLDVQKSESFVTSKALGLIVALRMIINQADDGDEILAIANCCRNIGQIVTAFVSHPSPEGHIVSLDIEEGGDLEVEEGEDDDGLSFSVMTFCWRAVKESSSLLAECLRRSNPLVLTKYVELYGRYLVTMLLKIRHPGAFMSIAQPLRDICQICYASEEESILGVPDRLLFEAVSLCITQPEVQTTRRSAGLPFCISAIVTASRDVGKRGKLLCFAIDQLLGTAELSLKKSLTPGPQVVHTLNILRQIFRDANLAEDVIPYIPIGFTLCFKAFASPSWVVRNSAMMLFAALMNRTFGVRHEAEEFSPINLLDIRAVHSKCQDLLNLVSAEFKKSRTLLLNDAENNNSSTCRYEREFAVYPLLSFIQRVRFSTSGERRHLDFYMDAAAFCRCCLANDIMKVRKMAARLLLHMCESPSIREWVINDTFKVLSENQWKGCNELYGYLLLAKGLERQNFKCKFDFDQTKGILEARKIFCPPIDNILINPNDNQQGGYHDDHHHHHLLGELLDFKSIPIEEVYQIVSLRRLSRVKASLLISRLVNYALEREDEMSGKILRLFESFWTDYDLSGTFRLAVLENWAHSSSLPERPIIRRIQYLALTDDSEQVRNLASGAKFRRGEPCSVPQAIRHLLGNHLGDIADLLNFMPTIDQANYDSNRRSLFAPEPLNSFKDPQWEQYIITANHKSL